MSRAVAPLRGLRRGPQVTDGSEKSTVFSKENQVQIVPTKFRQSRGAVGMSLLRAESSPGRSGGCLASVQPRPLAWAG